MKYGDRLHLLKFLSPAWMVLAVGLVILPPTSAPAEDYNQTFITDPYGLPDDAENPPDESCKQAWPVDCAQGEGQACGGWRVIEDLAEPMTIPGEFGTYCSTGTSLALLDPKETQGQPVGAMLPGTVVFSQNGKSRDGKDYGGVIVIKLKLDDGSPQCYQRFMFLDRRDLVRQGVEVKPGQRIGSIARNDMSASHRWWGDNWPNVEPHVKIDIGCDEALVNLPHFMPREPYTGSGPQDRNSCALTKIRFPTRVLEYLTSFEDGSNSNCKVGWRKDAREGIKKAKKQDNRELDRQLDSVHSSLFIAGAKPFGQMKHKQTPAFSVFNNNFLKNRLYTDNLPYNQVGPLLRRSQSLVQNTSLMCDNMDALFVGHAGGDGDLNRNTRLTPEEVRELLAYCSNQHILGHSTAMGAYAEPLNMSGFLSRLITLMPDDARTILQEHMEAAGINRDNIREGQSIQEMRQILTDMVTNNEMEDWRNFMWQDTCQPMNVEIPAGPEDYKISEILTKAWKELLIEWPQDHDLRPTYRDTIPPVKFRDYAEYPYERILDPSHPFSPRHIYAETDRERYSNYGVACAASPVDIVLSIYGDYPDYKVYSRRDLQFHSCMRCRININENSDACFPDPYSFETKGGCGSGSVEPDMSAELCPEFTLPDTTFPDGTSITGGKAPYPEFKDFLYRTAEENGLVPEVLHASATMESGCIWNRSRAGDGNLYASSYFGMFQMATQYWAGSCGEFGGAALSAMLDPLNLVRCAAKLWGDAAENYDCQLDVALVSYACGPAVANIAMEYGVEEAVGAPAGPHTYRYGDGTSCEDNNHITEIYIPKVLGMTGITDNNACLEGGPSGTSSTSGPPSIGLPSVFTELPGSATGGFGNGNFNPDDCSSNDFAPFLNETPEGKRCAAYSYPVPDSPGNGYYGCWGRTAGPGGSTDGRWYAGCSNLNAYSGPSKPEICTGGCPGRIHEGEDIMADLGTPVYAAASGRVSHVSEDGYSVNVSHAGYCMTKPGTDCPPSEKFPSSVETRYLHMGSKRVMVERDQEVNRCTQLGTVGDYAFCPGGGKDYGCTAPHLHFETWDDVNNITGGTWGHFPRGQAGEVRYRVDMDDKSCSGGIWDPEGKFGGKGICKYKLPVSAAGKEDLTPPEYLTDYSKVNRTAFPEIQLPDPPSEKKGDPFDLEVPGMVYNGAWTECDKLEDENKAFCLWLNIIAQQTPDNIAQPTGNENYINPLPCQPLVSPYGQRWGRLHNGVDLGSPIGTPVFAARDGVVEKVATGCPATPSADCNGGAGNYIEIRHPDGALTRYLHQDPGGICPQTKEGESVVQGQVISHTGNSGHSTGPHLHFEIHAGPNATWNSVGVDPMTAMPLPTPGAACQAQYETKQCGETAEGLSVGGGIGGGGGKQLCVDHPCSTRYDEADTVSQCAVKEAQGCGPLGGFVQRDNGEDVGADCCYNATRPVAPMNLLKMRPSYDDQARTPEWTPDAPAHVEEWRIGAWDEDHGGVPEGFGFSQFFKDHQPYMRWWDTGASSGMRVQELADAESPDGQYDALVGVGVEKSACGYSGDGTDSDETPDGNTSWTEMKLYQARGIFHKHLNCVPRYEKAFKQGSAEELALLAAGGGFWAFSSDEITTTPAEHVFPLGWRGYASEPMEIWRFPYLTDYPGADFSAFGSMFVGLDNVAPGDIIIWDEQSAGANRLPHVAVVVSANNALSRETHQPRPLTRKRWHLPGAEIVEGDTVTVIDRNFGKFPDVCGNTNWHGVNPVRIIHKSALPETTAEALSDAGISRTDCGNPDLATCSEPLWGSLKVYRPRTHVRE